MLRRLPRAGRERPLRRPDHARHHGPDLAANACLDISASDFSFIGADGVTFGDVDIFPAFICPADDEQLPTGPLGGGQQYVGTLVLDVPATSGILQFQPYHLDSGSWEWSF